MPVAALGPATDRSLALANGSAAVSGFSSASNNTSVAEAAFPVPSTGENDGGVDAEEVVLDDSVVVFGRGLVALAVLTLDGTSFQSAQPNRGAANLVLCE